MGIDEELSFKYECFEIRKGNHHHHHNFACNRAPKGINLIKLISSGC